MTTENVPTPLEWRDTLRHWLLVLGVALLVSGVVYFGAYNWEYLGRLQKLGLLELLLTGFFAGVLSRGMDSKEGSVLLISAAALVGGLLAVLGQQYQTGADSYALFLCWAVLILPWCLAGRSNVLWCLQFIVLNTAFSLWWMQGMMSEDLFPTGFLLLNGGLAAIWGRTTSQKSWMREYPAELLLAAALTPLTFDACLFPFDEGTGFQSFGLLGVTLGTVYILRREHLTTMVTLSASLLSVCTSVLARFFLEADEIGFLLVAVSIMVELTFIARWLTGIHRRGLKRQAPPVPEADEPKDDENVEPPWYFQLLVGTAAWFSSLFVLCFFLAVLFGTNRDVLAPAGAVLYALTLWYNRSASPSSFLRHALLSTHLGGLLTLIGGLTLTAGLDEAPALMLGTVFSGLSALTFRDAIGRFLFSLGFVGCGLGAAFQMGDETGGALWLVLLAAGLTAAYLKVHRASALEGLCAGFLVSILIVVFECRHEFANSVLMAGLLLLALWAFRHMGHPLPALGALGVLTLITQSVPSLPASVLVYALGFYARQGVVRGMALLALIASGSFYYYNLDLTFMTKSAVLLASGVLLLGLRVILRPHGSKERSDEFAL